MASFTTSIKVWHQKVKTFVLSFFAWRNHAPISQEEADKKLVYSLSTRKLPTKEQLRHLHKFLNPREFLIVKICSLIVIAGLSYYFYAFIFRHLDTVPERGGTYSEALIGYPRTINPLYALSRDADADLSRLIYSSLYQYNAEGRLAPDLAESLTISEDGKEYVIKIRDGVVWHNGERLTADDIVFTVETIQNSAFRSPLRQALSVAEVEKIDDLTVKFKLNEAYSPFIDLLNFGILPKRLWEGVGPDGALISDLNLKPIGSGPFRFESLIRSSSGEIKEIALIVNTAYYGHVPYIESLNFKFFPNYEEAIKALNSKEVSGISYLPWELKGDILAQNSLNFYELGQPRVVSLFFNQVKNPALAKKETRVALSKALDRQAALNSALGASYQPASSPLPPSSWAHDDNLTKYPYEPAAAKEIFAATELKLSLTAVDSGANAALAEEIKRYWEEAGVKVEIKMVTAEQATEIVKNRDFEILLYGQFVGGDPDIYAFWHSSQASAGGFNLSAYNNSDLDKLLLEARSDSNEAGRLEKYRQAQELINVDAAAISLYSPVYTYVQGNKLKGFHTQVIINPSDRFSTVSDWYLKTDRRFK